MKASIQGNFKLPCGKSAEYCLSPVTVQTIDPSCWMNEEHIAEITRGVCLTLTFPDRDGFHTATAKVSCEFPGFFLMVGLLHWLQHPKVLCIPDTHKQHFPTQMCTSCAQLWCLIHLCTFINAYRFWLQWEDRFTKVFHYQHLRYTTSTKVFLTKTLKILIHQSFPPPEFCTMRYLFKPGMHWPQASTSLVSWLLLSRKSVYVYVCSQGH